MTRHLRGLLLQILVVLAIASLASIALAPRGMLRAAAADDLDRTVLQDDGAPSLDEPADPVLLPGVRAVVSREEQDPGEVLRDALTTAVLPGGPLALVPADADDTTDRTVAPPAPRAHTSTHGDRAPPSSI